MNQGSGCNKAKIFNLMQDIKTACSITGNACKSPDCCRYYMPSWTR